MVFTKLSVQEKEAFFGLLDEYFQSRPELFGHDGDGQGSRGASTGFAGTGVTVSPAAAASVVQRALAASTTIGEAGTGAPTKSNNPFGSVMTAAASAANEKNNHHANAQAVTSLGRVAAASLAFSGRGTRIPAGEPAADPPASEGTGAPPPTLPRRMVSNAPAPPIDHIGVPGVEVDKLVTKKTSVFSAFKKPPTAGAATIPPAFATPKNTFGPPPARRVIPDNATAGTGGSGTGSSSGPGRGSGRTVAAVSPPSEQVAEGEWAEVLYDYSSEDPADLAIEAGTRVFITAKSSEDWWTGQVEGQGREGLVPAAYVKLL